jgi:hypothetical protein
MERRAPAFGCFAVPAAIFELLAQELIGQCVVRFFEIRADAEDSAVDAGLRFAVKERPVVEPLKHEPLVDAVDHFASLLAGGVETEVLQDDESVEGISKPGPPPANRLSTRGAPPQLPAGDWSARSWAPQPSVATRDRSAANRAGGCAGKVPHHLPADGRVGIEEPLRCAGRGA